MWCFAKNVPNTSEVIADNLIKMFILGPDVSFNGSPTVSPTTAALCGSVFFLKYKSVSLTCGSFINLSDCSIFNFPANLKILVDKKLPSIYFFALSQAPPVFDDEIAIWIPETITPVKYPATDEGPKTKPRIRGEKITKTPGMIISFKDALVEILMQASWSKTLISPLSFLLTWDLISSHYEVIIIN